jgi:transcriptional regulator with XRE-family HTH domain
VKARRTSLGLSQGAMIRELGYVSRNSISNVETGREGLPPKRVYAWADLLQVPREAFFRFVTGESLEPTPLAGAEETPAISGAPLDEDESALLLAYRSLDDGGRRQVRNWVRELVESPGRTPREPRPKRPKRSTSR